MNSKTRNLLIGGLAIALIIAILSPFLASSNPDGLEGTAEGLGVQESEPVFQSPLPDYTIPGMEDSPIGGVIAVFIETIIVFLVMFLVAKILLKKNKENGEGREET